jgi:hypothetical protein
VREEVLIASLHLLVDGIAAECAAHGVPVLVELVGAQRAELDAALGREVDALGAEDQVVLGEVCVGGEVPSSWKYVMRQEFRM